jgi:hypothetical protein
MDGDFIVLGSVRFYRRLFSEEGKNEGQKDTDNDARHEGEVEGELVPLDIDITGEPADPGDLIP